MASVTYVWVAGTHHDDLVIYELAKVVQGLSRRSTMHELTHNIDRVKKLLTGAEGAKTKTRR